MSESLVEAVRNLFDSKHHLIFPHPSIIVKAGVNEVKVS